MIKDSNDSEILDLIFNIISGTNKLSITLQTESTYISYYSNAVGDYSKFMIRPAGIDSTYVPYAMTNQELTERIFITPYVEVAANSTAHIDYPDGFTRLGTRVINIDVENTYQDQVNFGAEKDDTGFIIYNNISNTRMVSLVLLKV